MDTEIRVEIIRSTVRKHGADVPEPKSILASAARPAEVMVKSRSCELGECIAT